jgi:hypothetical protein
MQRPMSVQNLSGSLEVRLFPCGGLCVFWVQTSWIPYDAIVGRLVTWDGSR